VGRHHEFAADAESARVTRRPLSLARALLKVYLKGIPASRSTGLFGRGSRAELVERIEALIALDAAGLGRGLGNGM
jgi:Zn-dependent protease with chaperone function